MFLPTLLLLASTAIAESSDTSTATACSTSTSASAGSTTGRLWASNYDGNVYMLNLKDTALTIGQTLKACGTMPSWLTLDSKERTVYCHSEDGSADPPAPGTVTALKIGDNGQLKQTAISDTIGGSVNSAVYKGDGKKNFLAIAHYGAQAVSTYELPITKNTSSIQHFNFGMDHKGPTEQQAASHPHEVYTDPTGGFLMSNDLGADLVRIWSIDGASGQLKACPSTNITLGSGPRHSVFWTDGKDKRSEGGEKDGSVGKTMMYMVNEIGGNMMAFDVKYARSGCLSLEKTQTLVPYPKGKMPKGATPSGIQIVGNAIYVSIRSDQGFKPADSMVVLDRSSDGKVKVRDSSSSHGTVPRTFVINKAGNLVAIGNQASATVSIVRRDQKTGALGEQVAILQVGKSGKVGSAEGLSSVIWDEKE